MALNVTDFRWTGKSEQAALLVADDSLSDQQIADKVGISKRQLERWKEDAFFADRVQDHVIAQRAALKAEGIANKKNRVARLNEDWLRMQALRDARATVAKERRAWEAEEALKHPEQNHPPHDADAGSETGLLVRQEKPTQYGTVLDYAFDRALMAELRAHEEQAAKELGQWVEKTAATDPSGDHAAGDPHTELLGRIAELATRARVRENHPEPAGSGSEGAPH